FFQAEDGIRDLIVTGVQTCALPILRSALSDGGLSFLSRPAEPEMTTRHPTALIADDEPLLRKALTRMLAKAWPELEVVIQARNGREAVELFEAQKPDICFLDVHMPGMSGVEAARMIGRRAHLVFVTAYDQYAVQAFDEGALDYLVKPVERARLADTVARLQERLRATPPSGHDLDILLEQLTTRIHPAT